MAHGTRTVYASKRIKGSRSVQQPKHDKHGDKDEDSSPKNVTHVYLYSNCFYS